MEFNYNMEHEKQMLSANLTRLQMQASQFPDVKRTSYKVTWQLHSFWVFVIQNCALNFYFVSTFFYSKWIELERLFQVLNPCSLTFKYLTPASSEGGQDIAIELEEMVFEFSPGLLTTVGNVVTALTGQQKVGLFCQLCTALC